MYVVTAVFPFQFNWLIHLVVKIASLQRESDSGQHLWPVGCLSVSRWFYQPRLAS